MTNEDTKQLITKYNAGHCTEEEKALLDSWYYQFNEHPANLSEERIEKAKQEVRLKLLKHQYKRPVKLLPLIISSAAVLIIIAFGILYYVQQPKEKVSPTSFADIKPGSKRATITFSNGQTIDLDENKSSVMVNGQALQYADGTPIQTKGTKTETLNIISTPKGGEYQIILSDGTKIWLNADTKLEYPGQFNDQQFRKVRLISGEAYFEVAKNRSQPFILTAGPQEVLVVGTHFNINAYQPEIKTTLLEGIVKVSISGKQVSRVLQPGQQSTYGNEALKIAEVDSETVLAWKNGRIEFYDADIQSVMSQLERWYDVEIVYEYIPKSARFSGSLPRSISLSKVLKSLESTGEIHFKIEGRRVMVTK